MLTSETVGKASSASSSNSAPRINSASGNSVDTTNDMTSLKFSTRTMSACSASSGGKSASRSTAASTSSRTRMASTKSFSSAVTVPRFSDAVESTRSMPSMPKMDSSTRRVIPSSTSVGVAPG